jgi:6-phosphofructokinase 2
MTAADVCSITTLTLNPAVDATYEIGCLLADQKSHARSVRYDPGGNGIDVGRALKVLGASAHNFCVAAGEIGQLFQRLASPSSIICTPNTSPVKHASMSR